MYQRRRWSLIFIFIHLTFMSLVPSSVSNYLQSQSFYRSCSMYTFLLFLNCSGISTYFCIHLYCVAQINLEVGKQVWQFIIEYKQKCKTRFKRIYLIDPVTIDLSSRGQIYPGSFQVLIECQPTHVPLHYSACIYSHSIIRDLTYSGIFILYTVLLRNSRFHISQSILSKFIVACHYVSSKISIFITITNTQNAGNMLYTVKQTLLKMENMCKL